MSSIYTYLIKVSSSKIMMNITNQPDWKSSLYTMSMGSWKWRGIYSWRPVTIWWIIRIVRVGGIIVAITIIIGPIIFLWLRKISRFWRCRHVWEKLSISSLGSLCTVGIILIIVQTQTVIASHSRVAIWPHRTTWKPPKILWGHRSEHAGISPSCANICTTMVCNTSTSCTGHWI